MNQQMVYVPQQESVEDWQRIASMKGEADVELIRELTESKDIPPQMRELMWAFMAQENVWGNIGSEDEKIMNQMFMLAWDWFEFMSPEDIEPNIQFKFINSLFKFRMRLTRARGGFERQQENTTIAQTIRPESARQPGKLQRFFRKLGI